MAQLNVLPKITWRWVQANDAEVKIPYAYKTAFNQYEDRVIFGSNIETFEDSEFGVSKEALEINEKYRNWTNDTLVEKNQSLEEKYEIFLDNDNKELIDLQQIHLEEGARATLIFDYKSEDAVDYFRNSVIRIKAEKNSSLTLILVQKFSNEVINLSSIYASVEDGAKVELVQVDLGSKETYMNYKVDLLGPKAESSIHSAYFVDEERIHDINYLINHRGKETISDMQINGALKDLARKRFVGTLDFKTGSAGSVGNEEEFVTLIDEEVRAIALPLLLASEHDIMGNHAASAGRIDQDMLIYLMSRGLNEKEAKALAVEAKMTPTVDLIPDEDIKAEVKKFIHEGITQ